MTATLFAEPVKTIFNPFTGKQDYITRVDSSTLPPGSTNYIQNTFNPTTNTQVFNVQQGSFGMLGFIMTDLNGCPWDVSVSTNGAITTLGPRNSGLPLGILLAITTTGGCNSASSTKGQVMGILNSITYP